MQAKGRPSRNEGDRVSFEPQLQSEGVVLFIDVDAVPIGHWPSVVDAIRSRGQLKSAHAIGPGNSRALQAATDLGIEYTTAVPLAGGSKDPSDIALATRCVRLATQQPNVSIALAAYDSDFLYLAKCLISWGHAVTVLVLDGQNRDAVKKFAEEGCQVGTYRVGSSSSAMPKFKAVLQSNGMAKFERIAESEQLDRGSAWDEFRPVLSRLGYLPTENASMPLALIKFAFTNGIDVAVFPEFLINKTANKLLHQRAKRDWKEYPGNLAYFCPQFESRQSSRLPKEDQEKFGSDSCRAVVRAGGPFIVQDSPDMVPRVLQRLGYLDDGANPDLNEAIDLFFAVAKNRKELARIGMAPPWPSGVGDKCAFLRRAFLSPLATGRYKPAVDVLDRMKDVLLRQGFLTTRRCSTGDMHEALLAYANVHELPACKNYKRLAWEALQHSMEARGPSPHERRSHQTR